jgi:phenylpyruvate tautomerase PptA (4-oxalocrotonate tautomerase family)
LGIEYSEEIIFIQATISLGRSVDLKKNLYKAICESLVKKLNVRPQDIFINLLEVSKENWSFGNGEMQYADKD